LERFFFVENLVGEKRREKLCIGEYRGTWKLVIPWIRLGIGFYSFFLHCLGAEMSLRCRWRFPGKERCLLDHLLPLGTSCHPSFSPSACDTKAIFDLLLL
jgi:hypothetical protein